MYNFLIEKSNISVSLYDIIKKRYGLSYCTVRKTVSLFNIGNLI